LAYHDHIEDTVGSIFAHRAVSCAPPGSGIGYRARTRATANRRTADTSTPHC